MAPRATAANAKMVGGSGPAVNVSAEDRYGRVLDGDFSAGAAVLRRLARRWYGLLWLDLDGCEGWWGALAVGGGEGVEWGGEWGGVRVLCLRSEGGGEEARRVAGEVEGWVRGCRGRAGWIDVLRDGGEGEGGRRWARRGSVEAAPETRGGVSSWDEE